MALSWTTLIIVVVVGAELKQLKGSRFRHLRFTVRTRSSAISNRYLETVLMRQEQGNVPFFEQNVIGYDKFERPCICPSFYFSISLFASNLDVFNKTARHMKFVLQLWYLVKLNGLIKVEKAWLKNTNLVLVTCVTNAWLSKAFFQNMLRRNFFLIFPERGWTSIALILIAWYLSRSLGTFPVPYRGEKYI